MSAGRCGIVSNTPFRIEGAQLRATPVVGCAHATTLRPWMGAGRVGAMTTPDTSMVSPSSPVDAYRIFHAAAPGRGEAIGSERRRSPGLRRRTDSRSSDTADFLRLGAM